MTYEKISKDYSLDDIDLADAISALYRENGYETMDKDRIEEYIKKADKKAVGQAAKEFLIYVPKLDDKDLLVKLDEQLNDPPQEDTASLDVETLPLIITGCLALLNVTSSVTYKDGKISYDPRRAIDVIKANIDGVVSILKAIIPIKQN